MNLLNRPGVFFTDVSLMPVPRWTPDELPVLRSENFGAGDGMTPDGDLSTTEGLDANAVHANADAPDEGPDADELARLEIEARIEDAFTTGYEEGRLAGEIAEGVRLRNAVAAAETALDEIREHEATWQHAVEENIAALAVTIARHIIGRELHSDAETIAEHVRRALAEFPIDQPMRIRVNPHDLSLLSAHGSSNGLPFTIAPNRDVRWHADARLTPGGCIVEGRERIVDGRIDTALERVYRRLTYTNV